MSYNSMLKTTSVAALLIGMGGAVATAQNDNMFARDRVVGAGERHHPEFTPDPVRVGAFLVEPNAKVTIEHNSNVFASETDEEADQIVNLAPGLRVRSDWSRHEIAAEANALHREYGDFSKESNTSGRVRLRGRLDVASSLHLGASVGAERRIEARGETGAVAGVLEPGEMSTFDYGGFAEFRRDRVKVKFDARVTEHDYKDLIVDSEELSFNVQDDTDLVNFWGVEFDTPYAFTAINPDRDFRDNTRTNLDLSAAYAVTPDIAVYAKGGYQTREHDATPTIRDLAAINAPRIDALLSDDLDTMHLTSYQLQVLSDNPVFAGDIAANLSDDLPQAWRTLDNEQVKGQVGVSFQLQQLIRGDIAVGYFNEEFDSDLYSDKDGLAFDADVQWLPTELTTVSLGASRNTRELGSLVTPTAVVSEVDLRLDHELKRNIILFGRARYRDELFENTNLDDQDYITQLIAEGETVPEYAFDFTNTYTSFGIGASYKMNRNAHFELGADRLMRESDIQGQDFDQNVVYAGFRIFP